MRISWPFAGWKRSVKEVGDASMAPRNIFGWHLFSSSFYSSNNNNMNYS